MLLCLTLFDDAVLRRILPARLLDLVEARAKHQTPRRAATIAINAVAMLMVFLSLVQMDERFGGSPPGPALAIDDLFEPFHIVSPYGLFSVMTTTRNEIIGRLR
jgi:lipase maturation factor 1